MRTKDKTEAIMDPSSSKDASVYIYGYIRNRGVSREMLSGQV